MLKTKYREKLLIEACLKAKQSFVVDKMNVTIASVQNILRQPDLIVFKL
jgi:hypothetical protein